MSKEQTWDNGGILFGKKNAGPAEPTHTGEMKCNGSTYYTLQGRPTECGNGLDILATGEDGSETWLKFMRTSAPYPKPQDAKNFPHYKCAECFGGEVAGWVKDRGNGPFLSLQWSPPYVPDATDGGFGPPAQPQGFAPPVQDGYASPADSAPPAQGGFGPPPAQSPQQPMAPPRNTSHFGNQQAANYGPPAQQPPPPEYGGPVQQAPQGAPQGFPPPGAVPQQGTQGTPTGPTQDIPF